MAAQDLKFIVDAQLPPALAKWLKTKGAEATAVRDLGLQAASDDEIWRLAASQGAIVVTKDEDFAQLAAADANGPAIVWVRTGNVVNRLLVARFEACWTEIEAHLRAGARVVELR